MYFCLQLPQKVVAEKSSRILERQALEIQKKNSSYRLLDSDSEDENYAVPSKVKACQISHTSLLSNTYMYMHNVSQRLS